MAWRLPEEPTKRRHQIFKRVYQNMEHWKALMEDRGMDPVITDELTGEDIYIGDLLVGLDSLPNRQRQAFELICLQGYTESAARDELLPNSNSSTPVQQYAESALIRMVMAYDLYQEGNWPPPAPVPSSRKKTTIKRKKTTMAPTPIPELHPLVREHLENARTSILEQIGELQAALSQVNGMLGEPVVAPAPVAEHTPAPKITTPAPNPKPEGKPNLQDMAKELASAGISGG